MGKFYSDEPHAPGDKLADKPLVQNSSLGNDTPNMVPRPEGRFEGLGGPPHHYGKMPAHSHGFGHGIHQHAQHHLRVSGHPGAHRIGGKKR